MGGDGGTISSNRTYLRGAGKACHTADHPSNAHKRKQTIETERAKLTLSTCAISGAVLDLSPKKSNGSSGSRGGSTVSDMDIVACPYGKLYKREKVLEALLYRSQTGGGGGEGEDKNNVLGTHIRGMKDLHPVRFHMTSTTTTQGDNNGTGGQAVKYTPACPITGSEIGSGNVPCCLIVRTKSKDKKKKEKNGVVDDEVEYNPNVLSERAMKEMGIQGLQSEYGPFEEDDMIRLAPPTAGGVFEEIQTKWLTRMEEERVAKLKKKKDKKRKRGKEDDAKKPLASSSPSSVTDQPSSDIKTGKTISSSSNTNNGGRKSHVNTTTQIQTKKSAVDEARSTVQSAVAQSAALSNLFGIDKKKKHQSEKEKMNNLFTRNC